MKKWILLLALTMISPSSAIANGYGHKPPPAPVTINNDGDNHNGLLIGVIVLGAICWYNDCFKREAVKPDASASIVPPNPPNGFTDASVDTSVTRGGR